MKNLHTCFRLLSTGAAITTISMLAMTSTTASAGNYYNCADSTGCAKVQRTFNFTNYNATKYPIVMAHGFLGWNRLFNTLDYFNGIPQTLSMNGADVFTTKTSTVNSIEVRGEQLLSQIRTIKAITGSDKVNLVGHSQGGLDSRYVASIDPQAVASITTVASPHTGVGVADKVNTWLKAREKANGVPEGQDGIEAKVLYNLFEIAGLGVGAASGIPLNKPQEQSAKGFLNSVSEEAFVAFNKAHPGPIPSSYCGNTPANNVMNGVAYYSFSGVGQSTNVFDASDAILNVTGSLYDKSDLNDGLVTKCSSRIGQVIRDDYHMNHLDSINQLLGLVSWRETNPLTVYRQQMNRVKNDGY